MATQSKHLFSVFKEARNAYRERKAEIQAEKQAKIAERESRRALATFAIDDRRSVASSRKPDTPRARHCRHHRNEPPRALHPEQDQHNEYSYHSRDAPSTIERRHTAHDLVVREPVPVASRSMSTAHIDMDLAYGEAHPSSLQRYKPPDEEELQGLVAKAKILLEEADCIQHTATATMAHLQKNPDAMAAVALTLAEISTLVTKMAPGIVAGLKASAPGVFALLASPQFLIAAGVGVGVTIVMFGGYKIIKKLTTTNHDDNLARPHAAGVDDLVELQSEHLSRVEVWRRGVADIGASSVGTSVDGEFITPAAAAISGLDMTSVQSIGPHSKGDHDCASSRRSSKPSKHFRTRRPSTTDGRKKKDKIKKPSKLLLMFKS
jgi:hypothetical protein